MGIVFEKQIAPIEIIDTQYAEEYQNENSLPYTIREATTGDLLGYLFCSGEDSNTLYVEFIEVLDSLKGQGFGKSIVGAMYDAFDVIYLEGIAMLANNGAAYYFWQSVGAELSVPVEVLESDVDWDFDVEFVVTKEKFMNGSK